VSALTDIFVSGGTYSAGTAHLRTGGTFNVSGFSALGNDTVVTGGTPNNSTKSYTANNTGGTFSINFIYSYWWYT
jgi:hypothetical protein